MSWMLIYSTKIVYPCCLSIHFNYIKSVYYWECYMRCWHMTLNDIFKFKQKLPVAFMLIQSKFTRLDPNSDILNELSIDCECLYFLYNKLILAKAINQSLPMTNMKCTNNITYSIYFHSS